MYFTSSHHLPKDHDVLYTSNRDFIFAPSLRFWAIINVLFFFNFHGGAWKLPFTVQLGFNILIDRRAHLYFQEYVLESTSPDSGTKDSFSLYFHVQQTSHSLMSPQTLILWVDEWSRACRLILINLLEIEHNRPWLSERNLYSIKSALQILPFVAMW